MAPQITNSTPGNGDTISASGADSSITCSGTVSDTPISSMGAQLMPFGPGNAILGTPHGGVTMPPTASPGNWSFDFKGVSPGTRYNLTVWAQALDGTGASTIAITVTSFFKEGQGKPAARKNRARYPQE